MGGGPRWRRCCTGRRMFCCGRRRWWVCRVSTDFACLLQHLVYGVHVCPHGIKRHSNAKAHRRIQCTWFSRLKLRSHRSVFFFSLFLSYLRWRMTGDVTREERFSNGTHKLSRIKSQCRQRERVVPWEVTSNLLDDSKAFNFKAFKRLLISRNFIWSL